MSDTVFRTISNEPPAQPIPVPEGDNKQTFTENVEDLAPVERGDGAIYRILGTDDTLPQDEAGSIMELENYVFDVLKAKGIDPTLSSMTKEVENLKEEMGLDPKASLETVLDRMGGVLRAWKSLSFIKSPNEKKSLFLRLANTKTSKEMNEIIFNEMESRQIWQ